METRSLGSLPVPRGRLGPVSDEESWFLHVGPDTLGQEVHSWDPEHRQVDSPLEAVPLVERTVEGRHWPWGPFLSILCRPGSGSVCRASLACGVVGGYQGHLG